MDRSPLIIGAVVTFFFYTEIADSDLSPGDLSDSATLMKMNDIVIEAVHNYLQGQEKRLANLRMHIEDYSKEHEESIRQITITLGAATQESSVSDDEETKSDTDKNYGFRSSDDRKKYEKLCSGEILPPADIQKKLKCRYVDHALPFLKIAPFKEEEAYLDPRIVVYHDVIFEAEIETLKRLSTPKLVPSGVVGDYAEEREVSKVRIAKNTWFTDDENKYVKLLSQRVEHMTGLTVDTSESLQVAYYEIGGLYLPHYDHIGRTDAAYLKTFGGDRIATVLFYMNDVAKGGGTTFPELNFTIWPQKGSALFWHNLKRNGEGEDLSLHGACPVLSGTKWIATKWMHEAGQTFLRPCTLLKYE